MKKSKFSIIENCIIDTPEGGIKVTAKDGRKIRIVNNTFNDIKYPKKK